MPDGNTLLGVVFSRGGKAGDISLGCVASPRDHADPESELILELS
jgi:hypothetical protein